MRIVGLLLLVCLSTACKNKGTDADGSAPDPAALKAQQELIARRDKLLEAREKLKKLDGEITQIQATGGDASEKIKERTELNTQIESSTQDLLGEVSSKIDSIKLTGDKSAQISSREATLSQREKLISEREKDLAAREKDFLKAQSDAAQRWKDSCSMTAAAPVIIQQPKGGNWTNRDVTAQLQKAHNLMNKKGIVNSDLLGPAQGFENDATKAMNDNDMSRAYIAAANLVASVDAIVVNRDFVRTKMGRVNAQFKATKVNEATNKQLQDLLGDVTNSYSNGDFGVANKKLNQVLSLLAKS
jgi:hypothetical protein